MHMHYIPSDSQCSAQTPVLLLAKNRQQSVLPVHSEHDKSIGTCPFLALDTTNNAQQLWLGCELYTALHTK